jgi:hypothetical protein
MRRSAELSSFSTGQADNNCGRVARLRKEFAHGGHFRRG